MNPPEVIEYSSDKHYLADLESRGLRIIPSHFCDVGEQPTFFDVDFVVKPCVGAGSLHVERYRPEEVDRARDHVVALHDAGRDVLIQPYINSVDTLGERALIFVDGKYSHAMTKGALLNVPASERDFRFRREQMSLVDRRSGRGRVREPKCSPRSGIRIFSTRESIWSRRFKGGSSWSSRWSNRHSF